MKLALIGKSISHSRSPEIYKKLLGPKIQYDLLDFSDSRLVPSLNELAQVYDGLNITSPYKTHYFQDVKVDDLAVTNLGAINTISLGHSSFRGTNTDLVAVRQILKRFQQNHQKIKIIILGSGVMATLTRLLCLELNLSFHELSRKKNSDFENLDLSSFWEFNTQNIIINACSRDFVFKGTFSGEEIFWDYNYHFIPHQNTLPFKVKEYHDGLEMLLLQAQEAIQFFKYNKD